MVGTKDALGALAYKDKSRFTADLIVAKSGTRDYDTVAEALNAITKGKIFVKPYIVAGVITPYVEYDLEMKSNVTLEGVEFATVIKVPDSPSSADGIFVSAGSDFNKEFVIKNLVLDGNRTEHSMPISGINIENCNDIRIENVVIKNAYQFGIRAEGRVGGTYWQKNITIKNCKIFNNRLSGVQFHNNIMRCRIEKCKCYENGLHGIQMDIEHSFSNTMNYIIDNICYNNSQNNVGAADGIRIGDGWDNGRDMTVRGNSCYDDQGTKTQRYGINEDETLDYSLITNNDCRTNQHATKDINYVGGNSKICNNLGRYVAQGCD